MGKIFYPIRQAVSPELLKKYEEALARDVLLIQKESEFTKSLALPHADSYKFLGSITLIGKNVAQHGSVVLVQFQNNIYFVTARHCVRKKREHIDDCRIYVSIQGRSLRINPKNFICHDEKEYDLAVMKDCNNLKTDLVLDNVRTKVEVGDDVEAYGYPGQIFFHSKGKVLTSNNAALIRNTAMIWNGSSGGCLTVNSGKERLLAGIVSSSFKPDEIQIMDFIEKRSYQPISTAVSYKVIANFLLKLSREVQTV